MNDSTGLDNAYYSFHGYNSSNNVTITAIAPTVNNYNTNTDNNNNSHAAYNSVGDNENDLVVGEITLISWFVRLIVAGILGQIMAVAGIATNVINMVVYVRMGLRKDAMNVSLLGLSLADFCGSVTIIFLYFCSTPGIRYNQNLPFEPIGTKFVFSAWPNAFFVTITMVITAFITVERCLCVTYPLRVKQIFTPKKVGIIIISIYLVIIILPAIPIYHMYRMRWVFFPDRNRSVYAMVIHKSRAILQPIVHMIFSVATPLTCYTATIIATIIFVHKLKNVSKWRNSVTVTTGTAYPATTTTTPDINTTTTTKTSSATNSSSTTKSKTTQLSPRDAKATRMVAAVAILYITCYTPITIITAAMVIVPDLDVDGAHLETFGLIFYFLLLLQTTNGSLNIFIYYAMSSNYKTMFQTIFYKNVRK